MLFAKIYGSSCEVYATDEYDVHDNLVYKPPPLDKVWLDAEGCEQSKLELRQQQKRNDELMRNRDMAIADMAPTPATQGGPVPNDPVPDGALISDDDDDDSFISNDTESEGDFGGVDKDDDYVGSPEVNIPNEGAQGPNNFATDGEGRRRSTKKAIDRLVPGANTIKSYPETVWKS